MSEQNNNIDRVYSLEIARVTEAAAVAAARLRGQGNEKAADQAAVDAMRRELNKLAFAGKIVIGEGERDEAPMLFIGEELGAATEPKVDIAVDPLEGTTLCAKNQHNSLAVVAFAQNGSLLNSPDIYMEKIAIGPGYEPGLVSLTKSPAENVKALAEAKGVEPSLITACILDRPRHSKIIEEVREIGCAINLITDGDIAGVIHTTSPEETGIDIYMGVGGAPEGVLAAAALSCIGGQMQGRLYPMKDEDTERAKAMGIEDINHIYDMNELASGDVLFAATGVTDGSMLSGVKFKNNIIETDTVVMRAKTKTVRWMRTEHVATEKFN